MAKKKSKKSKQAGSAKIESKKKLDIVDDQPEEENDNDAMIEIVEQDEEGMVIDVEMDDEDEDIEDASTDEESGSDDEEEAQGMEEDSPNEKDDNFDDEEEKSEDLPIPFMDAFYSLSSENPSERTAAAHCLIRHCFPSSGDIQTKDAAYALRRLMAGLCSGRAGARQGYASALASFLRVAFATSGAEADSNVKAIGLIQNEITSKDGGDEAMPEDDESEDPAEFVRKLLVAQTTPAQPSKRGSEERDYIFGKLFGIMAIVRSGILASGNVGLEVSSLN